MTSIFRTYGLKIKYNLNIPYPAQPCLSPPLALTSLRSHKVYNKGSILNTKHNVHNTIESLHISTASLSVASLSSSSCASLL